MVYLTPWLLIYQGILVLFAIIVMIYHIYALKQCKQVNKDLDEKYEPSLKGSQSAGNAATSGNSSS